ncbi:MAG: type II toxin-antitoxin system VapC family toxin [Gammaproteobacteria bacterium]|nr:MAG: type II toxin-antitoxin system VapC family toxin [Gammaproteobacteria bacterium]
MRAVDTNVIVRIVVRDEPGQVRAAERFAAGGAWVSHVVLAEATWVLDAIYQRTAQQIAAAIDRLLNHKDFTVQDSDVVVAALEQFKERPTLGFSDCLVLEIARKAGHLPLGTFDRNLAKLAGVERLQS